MSERFDYQSPLAPYMCEFIELKQSSGCDMLRTKWILLEIDKFYVDKAITEATITSDIIKDWRETRLNDCPTTLYSKYSVWSQLAKFMCRQGNPCYITPLPDHRNYHKNFTPYIFTHSQMNDILTKSCSLRQYDRHMNCSMMAMPAIIRLLYSTGIRVSECTSIRNSDVHLDEGFIHLKKTKNKKERIVPICETLKEVLSQYITYRNAMPLANVTALESLLFIKTDGTCCRDANVYCWFKQILSECGIPHFGNHKGPRVHDLRHTFAVHSLEQMARNGIDLYTGLPILSTCLGHQSLSATEQYVRLTLDIYPELREQTTPINAFVYPKSIKGMPYEDEH